MMHKVVKVASADSAKVKMAHCTYISWRRPLDCSDSGFNIWGPLRATPYIMVQPQGLGPMVLQKVQTVVKLALERKEVLDVLLAEEVYCTFVIFYQQRFCYLIPAALAFVDLGIM